MIDSSPKKIFLSGICGVAMASLAGMLREAGHAVAGSDAAVYPPMSTFLESLGIPVFDGYAEDNLQQTRPDLVVIGNALSRGNPEVEYVLDAGVPYVSMAELVREFFIRGRASIVVAGTHGKTTTTAMLAWLLEAAGRRPSFLVGGIAENFGRSFQLGAGGEFVIEGDEYDTAFFDKRPKFLHYLPRLALVKNIEFDHADIYPDLAALETAFRRLMLLTPRTGAIIAGTDSPVVARLVVSAPAPVISFGLHSGEWRAQAIRAEASGDEFGASFDVVRGERFWGRVWIPLTGEFNVSNALSAIVAADRIGVTPEDVARGLRTFRNVKRRLEVRGVARGVTVYDDFAHHPTAVRETLKGVRMQHPAARLWAVFEPRSQTSRRRAFEAEFAEALAEADIAVIAPVYAASRLDPEEVMSPARVAQAVAGRGREAAAPGSTEEIVRLIAAGARDGDRVIVMSNGGFDDIHRKLLEALGA